MRTDPTKSPQLLRREDAPLRPSQAARNSDHLGHRARLRARLLDGGERALADYELLEAVLFAAMPRGDTKPLAKQLIQYFGSFSEVIAADPHQLIQMKGVGEGVIGALKVVEAAAARLRLEEAQSGHILNTWDALLSFCHLKLAHRPVEEFHLLFLNKKNHLIKHEQRAVGTIDQTPVYVREIIKRSLEVGATALILVHNHPSGNPEPSEQDINLTHHIQSVAEPLNIHIHDHLIFAKSGHYSFRSNGKML